MTVDFIQTSEMLCTLNKDIRWDGGIGGATLLYGVGRIGYDYYQSNTVQYYGPTYYTNGKAVRLW